MENRRLGGTELQVTSLGYGAMELRKVDEKQADSLLNSALDAGINFIDTAPDYGVSEERIGRAIGHRRGEYILASKCGCNIPRDGDDKTQHIWTREMVMHNIELSLKLLKTDHLDLWQIHSATAEEIRNSDVMDAIGEVQRQGKVRAIGYTAPTNRAPKCGFQGVVEFLSWDVFDVFQMPYCAVGRIHEDAITAVARKDAGVIVRGALKPGIAQVHGEADWEKLWGSAGLDELMDPSESRYGFMLRFAMTHPDFSTIIVGTRDPTHLVENVATAGKGPLSADLYAEAKKRLDAAGVLPEAMPGG